MECPQCANAAQARGGHRVWEELELPREPAKELRGHIFTNKMLQPTLPGQHWPKHPACLVYSPSRHVHFYELRPLDASGAQETPQEIFPNT
jgi:hypothetical protein